MRKIIVAKSLVRDLNSRPLVDLVYKTSALTTELTRPIRKAGQVLLILYLLPMHSGTVPRFCLVEV